MAAPTRPAAGPQHGTPWVHVNHGAIEPHSLSPPEAFGVVEAGVCRSNAPNSMNFRFLEELRIKTVVYLSPEVPLRAVTNFLEENNVKMVHLGLRFMRPEVTWRPISEELIKEALEIVLDVTQHPVLVVCTSGIHQTGTLVGCLRRLQRWGLNAIIDEYRAYAGSKARFVNEQFIELFDTDLVTLPKHLPAWFAEQQRMLAEEQEEFDLVRDLILKHGTLPPREEPPRSRQSSRAEAPASAEEDGGRGEDEAGGAARGGRASATGRRSSLGGAAPEIVSPPLPPVSWLKHYYAPCLLPKFTLPPASSGSGPSHSGRPPATPPPKPPSTPRPPTSPLPPASPLPPTGAGPPQSPGGSQPLAVGAGIALTVTEHWHGSYEI